MQKDLDIELLNQQIYIDSAFIDEIRNEAGKVIVGQQEMLDALLIGLLTRGHILLEGLPGLAKTLSIRALAATIDASFSRIQFTPDLLPADITGTMIYNVQSGEFNVRKGPVFANFVLADEINRAPAKVQSALLEAMQERQITIGKDSFILEDPFLVLATQNPIEQEGTYPLPEAQLDRFMLKVTIGYPNKEEEREIIRRNLNDTKLEVVKPVVTKENISKARASVAKIYMDEKIENYILDIVFASRVPEQYGLQDIKPFLLFGASPRASINIATAAKAKAFLNRRGYVIPEDVRSVCRNVLRHRLGLTYEAEAANINQDTLISSIINKIKVP
jgi:MoxR-like ATPase